MKKKCTFCCKPINERYRINELGEVFCDDDCYDNYYETHEIICEDWEHPYIDDYESIRSNYLDWLDNWESEVDLDPEWNNLQHQVDKVLDRIDEVFVAYRDYYQMEGDDGVFAREIYLYLLKFEELQKKILQWRPEREVYFYLSLELIEYEFDKVIYDWTDLSKYLFQIDSIELYELLKNHVHPYDSLAFYFETEADLNLAVQKIEQTFHDDIDIYSDKAFRCEGECADIELGDISNLDLHDSWLFCDSCESFYYPGCYSIEELQNEIQRCDRKLEDYDKLSVSDFYLRKIKRSCRYHDVEFPEWLDLIS